MGTSFYSEAELRKFGFKSVGKNVLISKFARFYSQKEISLGDNVRIDDFCILSGNVTLGSFVHISSSVKLFGTMGIVLEDYTGISSNSIIYSAMDDFSGQHLIGPMSPDEATHVTGGCVRMCKFSQVGAGCVVFPNLTIGKGTVVGAMSLVRDNLEEWFIYAGIPVKKIKKRSKDLLSYLNINS